MSGGKTGVCRFFRKAELQSHGGKTSEVELSVDGVSRSDPDGHPECKYKNQHKPQIRNEKDINNILNKRLRFGFDFKKITGQRKQHRERKIHACIGYLLECSRLIDVWDASTTVTVWFHFQVREKKYG